MIKNVPVSISLSFFDYSCYRLDLLEEKERGDNERCRRLLDRFLNV